MNIQIWLLTFLLTLTTFFRYSLSNFPDPYHVIQQLMYTTFLMFFVIGFMCFKENRRDLSLKDYNYIMLFIGIVLISFVFTFIYQTPEYYQVTNRVLKVFMLTLIIFWGVVSIQKSILQEILNRYYFVAFLVGILFILLTKTEVIQRNQYLNSNTVGLFLVPYLIYLLIQAKGNVKKTFVYVFGIVLLYISNAQTSFLAFAVLPIFILVALKVKRVRILYGLYIFVGLLISYFVAIIDSDIITDLLTNRNLLWKIYMTEATSSLTHILSGTGKWVASIDHPVLNGLHAHHAYINMFYYIGIFGMLLYIGFIIFSMRNRINTFTVSDGILFLVHHHFLW